MSSAARQIFIGSYHFGHNYTNGNLQNVAAYEWEIFGVVLIDVYIANHFQFAPVFSRYLKSGTGIIKDGVKTDKSKANAQCYVKRKFLKLTPPPFTFFVTTNCERNDRQAGRTIIELKVKVNP